MNGAYRHHLCTCDVHRQTILSLDGGGIRGYGSLFILQELMKECLRIERELDSRNGLNIDDDDDMYPPLPCHYFDYVAGTSTGGLIAIMIGRLRMPVDKAIAAYANLGKTIFRRSRWWRSSKYDHKVLERAIKAVIAEHYPQKEHRSAEYPFFETSPGVLPGCKTMLYALRKRGKRDAPYVFRSYEHEVPNDRSDQHYELKHRNVNDDMTQPVWIWQAARATSAAPTYFKTIGIDGYTFMDGGIGTNNPCNEAWLEAHGMHELNCTSRCRFEGNRHKHEPCRAKSGGVGIVVSIGTGRGDHQSIFTTKGRITQSIKAALRGVQEMTNPEETHRAMDLIAERVDLKYSRFNVDTGLENVKMDDVDQMEYIEDITKRWLDEGTPARRKLKLTARDLVNHRRARCPKREEHYAFKKYWKTGGTASRSRQHLPATNGWLNEGQTVAGASEIGVHSPNGHAVSPAWKEQFQPPMLELQTRRTWPRNHHGTEPHQHQQNHIDSGNPKSARSEGPVEMPEQHNPHELLANGLGR